jgi:hypothetical protein
MEKLAMSNTTTKLVTPKRLRQLLDCYGSTPSAWPQDERRAALTLLKSSPEMETLRCQAQTLDNLLMQHQAQETNTMDTTAMQVLQQRIMHELPEQDGDLHQAGHEPEHRSHRGRFWMGSLAASLFIVSLSFGVIHQLFGPNHIPVTPVTHPHVANQQNNAVASNDFDEWAWEDITGESLSNNTDSEPATMLALVDLELPAE